MMYILLFQEKYYLSDGLRAMRLHGCVSNEHAIAVAYKTQHWFRNRADIGTQERLQGYGKNAQVIHRFKKG